ncbi:MAG: hypothetical protein WAO21_10655 [Verrucomicrobiia bacterium]|jgi:hypothetical protein
MGFTIYDLRLTRKQTYGTRAARPRVGKAEPADEPSSSGAYPRYFFIKRTISALADLDLHRILYA